MSDPDVHEVRPYSEIYESHPHKMLATKHGWRTLHNGKCVWTGKSEKHMSERAARVNVHRDWTAAHNHRLKLIEARKSQTFKGLSDSKAVDTPLASVGVVPAEDHGASKASCLRCPLSSATCRLQCLRLAHIALLELMRSLHLRVPRTRQLVHNLHHRLRGVAGPW